jgi:hypothetical protein
MAVVESKEIGESCPGPLIFGSSVLPVSLDKEEDTSSESAWAWTRTRKKAGASLAKPVNTTGGASCSESQSMKEEVFFSRRSSSAMDGAHCQEAMALIEEQEETARAAKRKWQEEWKGPAAGGSNMEKGPRAYQNKLKKERKNKNYLKKAAHHRLRLDKRRDAERHAKGESARFRLFVNALLHCFTLDFGNCFTFCYILWNHGFCIGFWKFLFMLFSIINKLRHLARRTCQRQPQLPLAFSLAAGRPT